MSSPESLGRAFSIGEDAAYAAFDELAFSDLHDVESLVCGFLSHVLTCIGQGAGPAAAHEMRERFIACLQKPNERNGSIN